MRGDWCESFDRSRISGLTWALLFSDIFCGAREFLSFLWSQLVFSLYEVGEFFLLWNQKVWLVLTLPFTGRMSTRAASPWHFEWAASNGLQIYKSRRSHNRLVYFNGALWTRRNTPVACKVKTSAWAQPARNTTVRNRNGSLSQHATRFYELVRIGFVFWLLK